MVNSRTGKSVINAQVNLLSYVAITILGFFSRKVFLDYLGADFVGLTGTLATIIEFLNLANLPPFILRASSRQQDNNERTKTISHIERVRCYHTGVFMPLVNQQHLSICSLFCIASQILPT